MSSLMYWSSWSRFWYGHCQWFWVENCCFGCCCVVLLLLTLVLTTKVIHRVLYLMIRIINPAVVNVPKPRLVPQASEPVGKNASVKRKPKRKEKSVFYCLYWPRLPTSILFHKISVEYLGVQLGFFVGTIFQPKIKGSKLRYPGCHVYVMLQYQ